MIFNKYNKEENLYILNYPENEEELCALECRVLFNKESKGKYLFSNYNFDASNSPFIKSALRIKIYKNSLEEVIEEIKEKNISYENFKVIYLRLEDCDISYKERLESVYKVGMAVNGIANIKNPSITLGLVKVQNYWLFGEFDKNNCLWHIHDKKPKSYSNSLSFRVAKSLINIGVGRDRNLKVIDPCCGVGTVILEGLFMGIDIEGVEIKPQIASDCKRNLEFFNYKDVITKGNIKDIEKVYDVSIIDIPYGVFTPTTKEEQELIINSARKISKKLILISFENMDEMLYKAGFKVVDSASFSKGNFIRYISVCI
ncbi:SAM-dependent methyltransferase [Clostridium sp. LY3-2]|uniref:TRM11 family SAM-dependent methyltransferase n=1 Tax=Clostridium sp. LY3-2 TaxID=2942482 RepID=UPI0021532ADC|nr:SAM-dependent methyltransferase [Clostridium sp. LY3-2]MCR6515536.1 SAM-dependent methyltransferase [Clostridium sp. LY3-2]